MKIQIDTLMKTIRVEEEINLGELVNAMGNMFPDGMWREYKLLAGPIQVWNDHIIIQPLPQPWPAQPMYPPWWQQPLITYQGDSNNNGAKTLYNIDIQQ